MYFKWIVFFVINICLSSESDIFIIPNKTELIVNEGDSLEINCKSLDKNDFSNPKDSEKNRIPAEETIGKDNEGIIFKRHNVSYRDTGWYDCVSTEFNRSRTQVNHSNVKRIYIYVKPKKNKFLNNTLKNFELYGDITSYVIFPCRPTSPDAEVRLWFYSEIQERSDKLLYDPKIGFTMKNITLEQSGRYTCTIRDGSQISFILNVKAKPSIMNKIMGTSYDLQNTKKLFTCDAYGYPLPSIEWNYTGNSNKSFGNYLKTIETSVISKQEVISIVQLTIEFSGKLHCKACNDLGCDTTIVQNIFVIDVPKGFGIEKPDYNFKVGEVLKLKCYASIYNHTPNIIWFKGNERLNNTEKVSISPTIVKQHSHVSVLTISNTAIQDVNFYTCRAETQDGHYEYDTCELSSLVGSVSYLWIESFYGLMSTLLCSFIIIQFSVLSIYFLLRMWADEF